MKNTRLVGAKVQKAVHWEVINKDLLIGLFFYTGGNDAMLYFIDLNFFKRPITSISYYQSVPWTSTFSVKLYFSDVENVYSS